MAAMQLLFNSTFIQAFSMQTVPGLRRDKMEQFEVAYKCNTIFYDSLNI